MLVFDLIAGLFVAAVVLAILIIGIAQSDRYQDELEAQRHRRAVTPARLEHAELEQADRIFVRLHHPDQAHEQPKAA